MAIQPTMLRPAAPRPVWQTVTGLVLLLPALALLVTSYLEPTVWTIRSSFNRFTGLRFTASDESVGFDNYSRAFDAGLGRSIGFALSLAVLPLLAVLVVAPALAWAADRSGRTGRWVTRGLLTIPLAAFAPMAVAMARRAEAGFEDDLGSQAARTAYWLGTFGVATAIAVVVYLAAFRRRDPTRSPWPAVIIAGALGTLAVLAATLQEFTYSTVHGIGNADGATPTRLMIERSLRTFDFGTGAAISATVLLPLVLFGLAATAVIVLTGLRLEFDDRSAQPEGGPNVVAWSVGGVLLLLVLVITWAGLGPWLTHVAESGLSDQPTWVNTWIPPLLSTLIGVTVAALAAFGISALRPLGRHSEWLLAPFGLFLFVGVGPLALRAYAGAATADRLNSFLGLIPPSRVAIPALFVLALIFRGQALRRETLHQEGRPMSWAAVIVPALPMLALAYLVTWVVQAQNLLWPYITSAGSHLTAQLAILQTLELFDLERIPYARLLPPVMLALFLLIGVAAQLLYLDRVALRLGRPERDHPPRT